MSYVYGGLTLANVGDIITQTSVSTNFQKVVENSAGATAPTAGAIGGPRTGQLWYDTTSGALKVNSGTPAVPVWDPAGAGVFEDLIDVDVSTKVSLESGIMWDATAVSGGVTGQWVPNQIYDASPTGGASNDF